MPESAALRCRRSACRRGRAGERSRDARRRRPRGTAATLKRPSWRSAAVRRRLRAVVAAAHAERRRDASHGRTSRDGDCGWPDALAVLKSAITDKQESVQDEAVRRCPPGRTTGPGTRAAEVLLSLAKSGKKTSHQVLALRLPAIRPRGHGPERGRQGGQGQRVAAADPAARGEAAGGRGRQRRPRPGVLELLTTLASDPAVAEEAVRRSWTWRARTCRESPHSSAAPRFRW